MTFICSAVAREGIAILADSITTVSEKVVKIENINKHFTNKNTITKSDLNAISEYVPFFAEKHTDKLLVLDKYTVLTIAGIAKINDMVISDLVDKFLKGYDETKPIQEKINVLVNLLRQESIQEIQNKSYIRTGSFILSHYNQQTNKSEIHNIIINETSKQDLSNNPNLEIVTVEEKTIEKIFCEGQTQIANKILTGVSVPSIIQFVINTFNKNMNPKLTTKEVNGIIKNLVDTEYISAVIEQQTEAFQLKELHLQEAVDLVAFLYKMVVEIQKYENKYPDVGGHVKIAIIDKDGFQMLTDKKVTIPSFIN